MIFIVLGTMSEVIKFSPIIRELQKRKIDFKIVHNGQNIGSIKLLKKMKLPTPSFVLTISPRKKWSKRSKIFALLIGSTWLIRVFFKMYKLFRKEKPDVVFYQGDCATVPFTAIAGRLAGCKTAHRESGLRSHNLFNPFPEEIDRIIGDRFANFLFVPAKKNLKNLKKYKNKKNKKVVLTGEPHVVNLPYVLKLSKVNLEKNYILVNIHRFENITSKQKMNGVVRVLLNSPMKVIFPINLNTKRKLQNFGLLKKIEKSEKIKLIDPVEYIKFVHYIKNARAVITDSGGIQVEAAILKVPCIVFREVSEWTETVRAGATILSTNPEEILNYLEQIKNKKGFYIKVKKSKNPFEGKNAPKIIVDTLEKYLKKKT